ncbi:MAG: HAD family hydrolase [Anaerolineales bacterium]
MIQAVIFDFDGTILDTERAIFDVWQALFARFGCTLNESDWLQTIGTREHAFDPYAVLRACAGDRDWEAIHAQRRADEWQQVQNLPILPGVRELIAQVQQRGLPLGVVSSSPRAWVEGHLSHLGLLHHFATVWTGDDVPLTKPDPALYLWAAETLGVAPRNCLTVEDSPNGALATLRAGMTCVVVPSSMVQHQPFPDGVLRLPSLLAFDLGRLG